MKQRPHRVLSTRKLDPKNIIHINIRPNSKISSATNKSYLNRVSYLFFFLYVVYFENIFCNSRLIIHQFEFTHNESHQYKLK